MFREIRRQDRAITGAILDDILREAPYGFLATVSPDGWPYGIPISYVYDGTAVFFHCAVEGHKLDNIAADDRVTFTAVTDAVVLPDKFGTNYKSVVLFGRAREIFDEEKEAAMRLFIEKYSSEIQEAGERYIQGSKDKTRLFRIDVEYRTGKSRR